MNLTLTLKKGEQHLIYVSRYRKFPDAIKSYRVNVKEIKGDSATIIDLNDKNKEKSFYIYKVLEVIDIESTEDEVNSRLNWHRDNFFETFKPLQSFKLSKGLPLMKKKCSASLDGSNVKLNLGNYPADLTRDVHLFSFLCAVLKEMEDADVFNLSDCKKWNDFAKAVFPENFGDYDNYFKDEFNRDYKDDYIEYAFKGDIENIKDEIQDIKDNEDFTPAEKKEEISRLELEKELRVAKEKLAIGKKDLRGMLVQWFAETFNRKHDSYYFLFLRDVYDVMDFKQIDGFELTV